MSVDFVFQNIEALGPGEAIVDQALADIYVKLFRSFRVEPFLAQPQKAINGAVLGFETILEILYRGRPAAGFRWWLRRGRKVIQKGRTDVQGKSGEVKVDLPRHGQLNDYQLSVFVPVRLAKEGVSFCAGGPLAPTVGL